MTEAILLVAGALISGLVGFGFNKLETAQKLKVDRRAWGSTLYSQIYIQSPRQSLTDAEAPTIRLLNYSALSRILNSGVMDPDRESDLIDFFTFFESVVSDVNDRAHIYNHAWASGMDKAHLDKCFRDVQISYMDYIENQPRALDQVRRLFQPEDSHIYVRQEHLAAMYQEK